MDFNQKLNAHRRINSNSRVYLSSNLNMQSALSLKNRIKIPHKLIGAVEHGSLAPYNAFGPRTSQVLCALPVWVCVRE